MVRRGCRTGTGELWQLSARTSRPGRRCHGPFFLLLGIVAIPDDVTVLWSGEQTCAVDQPPCPGTWFGIGLPIPQTDPLYRQRFFEPLIADVAVSLEGRD